ncbi:hypothetical protein ACFLT1_05160 [Bacteroidota bacterium]
MADGNRIDRIYRNAMLITGVITGLLFILSMIALIEFPGAFIYLLIGEIFFAVLFFILRTVYRYRETFRIRKKST